MNAVNALRLEALHLHRQLIVAGGHCSKNKQAFAI